MSVFFQAALVSAFVGVMLIPLAARRTGMSQALLWGGYVAHLAASLLAAALSTTVLAGDVLGTYHPAAIRLLDDASALKEQFAHNPAALIGTPFVELLTWVWYCIFGIAMPGLFVCAALVGFTATCMLLTCARQMARSEKQFARFAMLGLFLPSFLLWGGMWGKDVWMVLSIALCLLGMVNVGRGNNLRGAVWLTFGIATAFVIRPHIAALQIGSVFATLAVLRGRWFGRLILGGAAVAVTLAGVSALKLYVGVEELSGEGIAGVITNQNAQLITAGTAAGVKVAGTGLIGFLESLPASIGAVLALPLPFGGVFQVLAGLETLFVLLLILRGVKPAFVRAVRHREPPLLFALWFSILFLVVMSIPLSANYGFMARQRTMLWIPLMFLLAMGTDGQDNVRTS